MKPYYENQGVTVYHGDCRDVLAGLEPETFTACITDPPYGLSFMGKAWDHGVPGVPFWEAIGRTMRPGAPLFAFSGTRTFHRQWCAIEDAGFLLKDTLAYMYGAGFPKSHDISKAIDKSKGAEREVVGSRDGGYGNNSIMSREKQSQLGYRPDGKDYPGDADAEVPVTTPATPEAEQWDGWGSALKPSWEPICYATKPRAGTYAENALRHGVAGLNIDGARIETDEDTTRPNGTHFSAGTEGATRGGTSGSKDKGRWPANVILDERASVLLDRQSGPCETGDTARPGKRANGSGWGMDEQRSGPAYIDSATGASRFFYTAKASKSDRTKGMPPGSVNPHPTVKPTDLIGWLVRLATYPGESHILDPFAGSGPLAYVAAQMGVRATLIEQDEESAELCALRLQGQQSLFGAKSA